MDKGKLIDALKFAYTGYRAYRGDPEAAKQVFDFIISRGQKLVSTENTGNASVETARVQSS